MMLPLISIVGLGWLGEPLALLLQSKGYPVAGSVTTQEKRERLQEKGIKTYVLSMNPEPSGEGYQKLFDADVLVVNIPPGRTSIAGIGNSDFYARQIANIAQLAAESKVKQILYISATSVYPDVNGIVREADILTLEATCSETMLLAEHAIKSSDAYQLSILRMGGLIGGNRIPGVHFSNKEGVAGHPPVNYIYQSDAVALAAWIIERELWGEIFNGVAPMHPSRKEVYERNAQILGFAPPAGYEQPPTTLWKEVSAEKIIATGFEFEFPNPLDFPYEKPA